MTIKRGSPITDEEVLSYLKNKSNIDSESDCWIWTGEIKRKYGVCSRGSRAAKHTKECAVHRVACTIKHGNITGLMARHRCNNKLCCNPDHIEPGTSKDNALDKYETLSDMSDSALIVLQRRLTERIKQVNDEIADRQRTRA